MLNTNQQIILNYIKSWAKDHDNPVPLLVLKNALTVQIPESTLRKNLLKMVIEGYLRENILSNRKSYTLLRTK